MTMGKDGLVALYAIYSGAFGFHAEIYKRGEESYQVSFNKEAGWRHSTGHLSFDLAESFLEGAAAVGIDGSATGISHEELDDGHFKSGWLKKFRNNTEEDKTLEDIQ